MVEAILPEMNGNLCIRRAYELAAKCHAFRLHREERFPFSLQTKKYGFIGCTHTNKASTNHFATSNETNAIKHIFQMQASLVGDKLRIL